MPVPDPEEVGGAVGIDDGAVWIDGGDIVGIDGGAIVVIDGAVVIGLGGGIEVEVDCVGGVGDDIVGVEDDDDDDDGKMQEPEPIKNGHQYFEAWEWKKEKQGLRKC